MRNLAPLSVLQLSGFEHLHLAEQVWGQARGLGAAGATVTTTGPPGAHRVRFSRDSLAYHPLPWAAGEAPSPETLSRLSSALSSGKYSLVHAQGLSAVRLAMQALASLGPGQRPPLVASLGEISLEGGPLARWQQTRRLRAVLRPCAAVVVPSAAGRDSLLPVLGPPEGRVQVIPACVPLGSMPSSAEVGFLRHRFGLSGQAAVVGLSSLFEDEVPERFLQAARQVLEVLGNVEFVLLGEGPRREACQELAHSLGLTGATVFLPQPASLMEVLSGLNLLLVLEERGWLYADALLALHLGVPLLTRPLEALGEVLPMFPQARLLEGTSIEALVAGMQGVLDFVPAELASAGSTPSAERVWDLGEAWSPSGPRTEKNLAQAAVLKQFSLETVGQELMRLYQRVLTGD